MTALGIAIIFIALTGLATLLEYTPARPWVWATGYCSLLAVGIWLLP